MNRMKRMVGSVAVGTLTMAGLGVVGASSASAGPVGCANYDFVIWDQGGTPHCFQGIDDSNVTISGPVGINMVNSYRHYKFRTVDGKWYGPYYGINNVSINGTIDTEEELF